MGSKSNRSIGKQYISEVVHPDRDVSQEPPGKFPVAFVRENKLETAVAANSCDRKDGETNEKIVYGELAETVSQFDDNHIMYAVIKSILPIPKQVGDIDILVGDIAAAESLLISRGYTLEGCDPYKRKYHRNADNRRIAVHLHDQIAWHGQTYLDKTKILENTVMGEYPRGEVAVPCPSHEASIIAAHMLFEKANNRILLLDVLCYWVWYHNDDLDLELMHSMADEYGWEFGLRCFLAGVADVYEQVYDEPFDSDNTLKTMAEFTVPYNRTYGTFLISFRQMYSIRKHRLEWLARNEDVRSTAHCFQTYVRDFVTELTNRYGFTYTKKRLRQ